MADEVIAMKMTPDQFAKCKADIAKSKDVESSTEDGSFAGTFKTAQVAMSYRYDQIGTLQLTVLEKHGIAKFASASTIQEHLEALLAQE